MFNTDIAVKTAFHVTKDDIKEVKAFTIRVTNYHGGTDETYYSTEKGWSKTFGFGNIPEYTEVVFDRVEAEKLQLAKKKKHLENIEKEHAKLKEEADTLKAELSNGVS
jgi:4-aminobutyrate aminotransferase-like enzyme